MVLEDEDTATRFAIATIPGDGIGREVVPAAIQVIEAAGRTVDLTFDWTELDWSCDRYAQHGAMMPPDGLDQLASADAILLGAVGSPEVADHISLWGLLIPIRRRFRQYVNLRPIRLFDGITSPVRNLDSSVLDMCVVRENNEGEYSEVGGRLYRGFDDDIAIQESIFTRRGVDRVLEYAFELAGRRRGRLTSATKSNGIVHTMPFWDERVAAIAERYPGVHVTECHVDALAAYFVLRPQEFDVVVASNLFGDILSDLAAAVAGSIGIAPAANINPEREFPSMFEPVHGSAPDIAGRGVANPVGQILSGAMMLDHLGQSALAQQIESAVAAVLKDPDLRTADLGGSASTAEVTSAITAQVSGG